MSRRQVVPAHLARVANPWFIGFTVILAWLLDLMPWGRWPGVPDLFVLTVMFWALHVPNRIGMLVAFVGGLLLDVHHAALLGEYALTYTLLVYWVHVLRTRLLRFGLIAQALHILPMLILATGLTTVLATLLQASSWSWWWLGDCIAGAVLWPLVAGLLQLPQWWSAAVMRRSRRPHGGT